MGRGAFALIVSFLAVTSSVAIAQSIKIDDAMLEGFGIAQALDACRSSVSATGNTFTDEECRILIPRLPPEPITLEEFNVAWLAAKTAAESQPGYQVSNDIVEYDWAKRAQKILSAAAATLLSATPPQEVAAAFGTDREGATLALPMLRGCNQLGKGDPSVTALVEELLSKDRYLKGRGTHVASPAALGQGEALVGQLSDAANADWEAVCWAVSLHIGQAARQLVDEFKAEVANADRNEFICGGLKIARIWKLREGSFFARPSDDPRCLRYYQAVNSALEDGYRRAEAHRLQRMEREHEQKMEQQLIQ